MLTRTLFSPTDSNQFAISQFTTLDEIELAVGERIDQMRYPEERLYVFTDGRGMLDVYPGDQYDIRQTTALWTTPMIPISIWNTGSRPLHAAVFRVSNVPVPDLRDGLLTWTAVHGSDAPAPGSGQNTVYVYETPRHEEGLHLRIHLIPLRRSQRTHDPVEMLILLPGGETQLHTHPDIEESIYVLAGQGVAHWGEERVRLSAGSALCYPPGVTRKIANDGDGLLTYVCHAASLDPE